MPNKKDYLIEVIFNELHKNSKIIDLERNELTEFINFLINNDK